MAAKSHTGQFLLVVETPENIGANKIRQNVERGISSKNISVVSINRLDYSGLLVRKAQKNMKETSVKKLFDAISKAPKELQPELREAAKELIDLDAEMDEALASSDKRNELLDDLLKDIRQLRKTTSERLKKAREQYKEFDD